MSDGVRSIKAVLGEDGQPKVSVIDVPTCGRALFNNLRALLALGSELAENLDAVDGRQTDTGTNTTCCYVDLLADL